MKIDLKKLETLVNLMEERDLGELELVDGESHVVLERAPKPPRRRGAEAPTLNENDITVTAPRVGIFLKKISAGDKIREGGLVGELRVMDVKYAVTSPATGRVEEVFVEDGMGVEYGQPLLRVLADAKGR